MSKGVVKHSQQELEVSDTVEDLRSLRVCRCKPWQHIFCAFFNVTAYCDLCHYHHPSLRSFAGQCLVCYLSFQSTIKASQNLMGHFKQFNICLDCEIASSQQKVYYSNAHTFKMSLMKFCEWDHRSGAVSQCDGDTPWQMVLWEEDARRAHRWRYWHSHFPRLTLVLSSVAPNHHTHSLPHTA